MTVADDSIMQPTRDPRATLPDLIEVLLNKGVHLNLDLIISVADIPLIGINLRATIAGIETMLEYGMMRRWDRDTRNWVQRSIRRNLPIADDEEIVAKMAGGHYQDDWHRTWRPGSAYLTSRRLIIHRRDPAETLWQARLSAIESISALREPSIGGKERTRLLVRLDDGSETKLSALDADRLLSLVRAQIGGEERDQNEHGDPTVPPAAAGSDTGADTLRTGRMWFLERLSAESTWRGGQARLTPTELTWVSPMDARARVRMSPTQLTAARLEERINPTDETRVMVLETTGDSVCLAAEDADAWLQELRRWRSPSDGSEQSDTPGVLADEGGSWR